MSSFDLVKRNKLKKEDYSLTFYVGHGYYQCFRTWNDFLSRENKGDGSITVSIVKLEFKRIFEIRKTKKKGRAAIAEY